MPQSNNTDISNVAASSGPANKYETKSIKLSSLQPHATSVRSMFVNGPFLFSASDDGTIHVYNTTTKDD